MNTNFGKGTKELVKTLAKNVEIGSITPLLYDPKVDIYDEARIAQDTCNYFNEITDDFNLYIIVTPYNSTIYICKIEKNSNSDAIITVPDLPTIAEDVEEEYMEYANITKDGNIEKISKPEEEKQKEDLNE